MTYGVCSIALVHYIFRDLTNMRATRAISTARPRPTSGRTGLPASYMTQVGKIRRAPSTYERYICG